LVLPNLVIRSVSGSRFRTSAALVLLISAQWVSAATYYISPSGNDANPGTSAQPYRTIARGVAKAVAGDTVIVGDGTYGNEGYISDGSGGYNGYAAPVTITTAGTASAWITLKAQNKGQAILDCGTTSSALGCDKYIYLNPAAAYWSIQDLVIMRGAFGGIGSDSGSSHIRITGCLIENIGYWNNPTQIGESGIGFSPSSTDWWIEGNVIHDVGRIAAVNLDHGIYAEGNNVTVINNIFYNMPRGWAIQLGNGAGSWLIANNTFAFPNQTQGGGHIMLWNTNNNITIRNNIFSNPFGSQSYAIAQYTSTLSGCSVDHNLIYGAAGVMPSPAACTLSNNQIGSNPNFTNVASLPYDFHVLAGGVGIDSGAAISSVVLDMDLVPRPQGAAYDLGAYEFHTAAPTPPSISGVFTSGITPSSAVINWSTNVPANSSVEYGLSSYTSTSAVDPSLVTQHSLIITGLQPSTTYHFQAVSQDSSNLAGYSSDASFTTSAVPVAISLSSSAPAVSVAKGNGVTVPVTASLLSGILGSVSFSVSALPTGVSASFSTSSCAPTCTTTMSLTATSSATANTYPLVVTAMNGAVSASTTINLTINNPMAVDLTSSLDALWDFSEGKGSTTADSSGNKNTGTLSSVAWNRAHCSGCVSMNGYSSYISVAESSSLEPLQQMTVSMWVNPSATSGIDPRIISKRYSWDVKLNGANRFPQFSAGGQYFTANYSLPLNQWRHVVFTFAGGIVTAYVNGQPVSASANSFTVGTVLPLQMYGLYLGTDSDRGSFYGGLMDDVRIYGRALSAADANALYSKTIH